MVNDLTNIKTSDVYLRKSIYKAHNGKCFYTGEKLSNDYFEIDHIIPVKNGGQNNILNYVLCSSSLNRRKKDKYKNDVLEKFVLLNKLMFVDKVVFEYNKTSKETTILKLKDKIKTKNCLLEKFGYYDVLIEVAMIRKESGLSQSKLADLINVDRRKIIDLEAGKIDFETLLKASDLLGIKIICKFEIE